jgi:gluconolactonase
MQIKKLLTLITIPSMTFIFVMVMSLNSKAQTPPEENTDLFSQAQLKLIASNFSFSEGPSVDKAGNVFFTDQPEDKIWKYDLKTGKLSIFLEKSGRANGTYFDKKGNLIVCADEKGEIWSVNPSGKVTVLVKDLFGKQLNGPNDLWIKANGDIYFTDPYYQRDYWKRTTPDLPTENVYFLPKKTGVIQLAADSLKRPNGIIGTPDGKFLYVADANAGKTFRYVIKADGGLSDKKLLINRGSDGMTIDEKGNLYLTGDGVYIFNPEGVQLGHIIVPEGTTNLCFAGKSRKLLFITARKAIYTLPMKVKGVE